MQEQAPIIKEIKTLNYQVLVPKGELVALAKQSQRGVLEVLTFDPLTDDVAKARAWLMPIYKNIAHMVSQARATDLALKRARDAVTSFDMAELPETIPAEQMTGLEVRLDARAAGVFYQVIWHHTPEEFVVVKLFVTRADRQIKAHFLREEGQTPEKTAEYQQYRASLEKLSLL